MQAWEWVSLIIVLFGYFIGIISLYIKIQIKLKELEMRVDDITKCQHEHEKMNEKSFNKLEFETKEMIDKLFKKIDEIHVYLLNKK